MAFREAAEPISSLPPTEKRSIDNGAKILTRYFEVYENDPWVSYRDAEGPFVERSFELPWGSNYIHGTIDCILKNTQTGELVVCDHKTATSLSDLANRVKPNVQFSIYAWAANQMGIPVNRVMVNGIQVAKTKSDFVRIFTDRNDEDYQEMRDTVNSAVRTYMASMDTGSWPQNTSSCSNYGGCQYLELCSLGSELRKNAIAQIYNKVC